MGAIPGQKRRKRSSGVSVWQLLGLALLVAGAGLIMAHPEIRKQVRGGVSRLLPGLAEPGNLVGGLSTIVPDFERYMKIRSM
jgi:hypothetical protein